MTINPSQENINYQNRSLNKFRAKTIEKYADIKCLDVGCGNGKYVNFFQTKINIYGCDYQPFDEWKNNPEKFNVCRIEDLTYDDSQFDLVTAFEVLEHIEDYQTALSELKRVSSKYIAVTVPNCELTQGMIESRLLFYSWLDKTHVNFWTQNEIENIFKASDLEIIESRLINNIDTRSFVSELFNFSFSGIFGKLFRFLLKILPLRKYPMTILLVAKKRV